MPSHPGTCCPVSGAPSGGSTARRRSGRSTSRRFRSAGRGRSRRSPPRSPSLPPTSPATSPAPRSMSTAAGSCSEAAMPTAIVGGVRLYYEDTGQGTPLVFVHEFAGDAASWHLQVRYFARRYRTITFAARGYLPSDVPEDPAAYSQDHARDDIRGVLDHLGIARAHVCGLSMGAYATLHFGLRYPERALSLVVAGCGS